MRRYIKQFLKDEFGGEALEFLCVLAIAAGIIAIGVKAMSNSNAKLSNMIDGI